MTLIFIFGKRKKTNLGLFAHKKAGDMRDESGVAYAFDWSPEKQNYSTECECGKEKPKSKLACDDCTWLDGKMDNQVLVISVLRNCPSGLTVAELCVEIYGRATPTNTRCIRTTLLRLERAGRVKRTKIENDVEKHLAGNVYRVIYTLKGK
jgi:hypothetical protein